MKNINTTLFIALLFVLSLSASKPKSAPATTLPVVTVMADATITNADHVVISRGGNLTLTLPSAVANTGLVLVIANHGTGSVSLTPAISVGDTETLSAITYNLGGNVITLISDGTTWRLIGQ